MSQRELPNVSAWPREFTLSSGKKVLLREPPPGVLWQIGLPPLDLIPEANPLPDFKEKPAAWSDAKWKGYQDYKKGRYLQNHAKWRKAGEKLASLLIFALTSEDGEFSPASYSSNPLEWQEDARLLEEADLSALLAFVRPSFDGWKEVLDKKEWDFAATTAKYFGGFPSVLILGDPLHAAVNMGIAQRAIKSENERAERAGRRKK